MQPWHQDYELNKNLQLRLKQFFKPLGIVAYSLCCREGCTGAYDENDEDFVHRLKGIVFIRLHLDGMNYDSLDHNLNPKVCYASYHDFDYLMGNWEQEKDILDQWCFILGLSSHEYQVHHHITCTNQLPTRITITIYHHPNNPCRSASLQTKITQLKSGSLSHLTSSRTYAYIDFMAENEITIYLFNIYRKA